MAIARLAVPGMADWSAAKPASSSRSKRTCGMDGRRARTILSPLDSVARSSSGNFASGGVPGLRQLGAVGARRRGLEFGVGMNLEGVDPIGEPLPGRRLSAAVVAADPVQPHLVEVGPAGEHLTLRQHVGLAAEATDALHAADEAGPVLGLDPAELGCRGSARQEAGAALRPPPSPPRARSTPGRAVASTDEQPADLPQIQVGATRRWRSARRRPGACRAGTTCRCSARRSAGRDSRRRRVPQPGTFQTL